MNSSDVITKIFRHKLLITRMKHINRITRPCILKPILLINGFILLILINRWLNLEDQILWLVFRGDNGIIVVYCFLDLFTTGVGLVLDDIFLGTWRVARHGRVKLKVEACRKILSLI